MSTLQGVRFCLQAWRCQVLSPERAKYSRELAYRGRPVYSEVRMREGARGATHGGRAYTLSRSVITSDGAIPYVVNLTSQIVCASQNLSEVLAQLAEIAPRLTSP